jgi:predicted ATP-grasp superfamily ATP-dependent carboligase
MSVLVTDGEQRSTLAVVRALGAARIPVAVASSQRNCIAGSSRYCTGTVHLPPPEERESYISLLLDELKYNSHDILIPMTDLAMQTIASIRDVIPTHVRLPFPGREQVTRVQDKREMLVLAERVGIACPKTIILNDTEELEEVAGRVQYPAVVKPRFSRFFRDGRLVYGVVEFAHDRQALISLYRRIDAMIPQPLVQEKLVGEGKGVFLLIWDGELKAAFCHRRLRERPPWGGASVLSESVALNQDLVEKSFALLKAVDWQGVAMVEFKVDRRDGQAKLMEVNGRFWGSLQLSLDAGINFPLMLYRLAEGEDVPPQFNYKIGVKSRWLLGDLDNLIIRLTHSREIYDGAGSEISKAGALLDFLKLNGRNLHYDVFRLDDPSPGWMEAKTYFATACRRIAGKISKRRKATIKC